MKRSFVTAAIAFACAANLQAAPDALITTLASQAPGLRPNVLRLALDAASAAAKRGLVARRNLFTVIDYSPPASGQRLFLFDLAKQELPFPRLVAHGESARGQFRKLF